MHQCFWYSTVIINMITATIMSFMGRRQQTTHIPLAATALMTTSTDAVRISQQQRRCRCQSYSSSYHYSTATKPPFSTLVLPCFLDPFSRNSMRVPAFHMNPVSRAYSAVTTTSVTSPFRSPQRLSFSTTDGFSNQNDDEDDERFSPHASKKAEKDSKPWIVPDHVAIPMDRVEMSFVRAGGAGGQNVNKVSTKVELKLYVDGANWIPQEVRDRIKQQQASRITKDGYLRLAVQEFRTQGQNRKAAFDKLEEIILEAYPRPKERNLRTGISDQSKKRNVADKRRRSEVKQNRKRVNDW